MPTIRPLNNIMPSFGRDCFLADTAVIVGDVVMGDQCSVWWNAVIRGDVNAIRIGHRVNIQDGAVLHCTFEKSQTIIGNDVSIGHNAIVHGCTIEDEVLIGMGAIVMDLAVVQKHVIVAAGAVVLENSVLESGWIYAGTPAKKLKELDEENLQFFITRTAENYIKYSNWFKT
ncbi:MAG TPA: gamma carbonic anhydrase family protein [Saprospiraceae bacterium]|nr:gamma carbonic anhydrase family protein [Saprospiraceae bacterium]